MPEDRECPAPGAPQEPILEISPDDLTPEAPPLPDTAAATPAPAPSALPVPPVPQAAPAELPATPPEPHRDDLEVTLVEEPAAPPPGPPPVVPAGPAEVIAPTVPPEPATPSPQPVAPVEVAPFAPEPVVPPTAPATESAPPAPITPGVPAVPAGAPKPVAPAPAPTPVLAGEAKWYTFSGGQVYGPYDAKHIRAWLRSGQVSWDTQASRGEGDPWRPLSAIAEFNPTPQVRAPVAAMPVPGQKDKTIAGILGILLGSLGIHHFYLGNTGLGLLYLLVSVLSVGILSGLPAIAGLIEGIIYLTAPEDRFQRNYHRWFLSGS